MITIPYEQCQFYYVTNHYDYHLCGTCIYNGKVALFQAVDKTDYQKMTDTCPYCNGQSDDMMACHCENAPDLFVEITELPFRKRVYYRIQPYISFFDYIRRWGIRGIYYWARWKY